MTNALYRTSLFDLHLSLGARIVPFAGYEMPVQYAAGVMKEHLATRTGAGLFDVGHMGQIILRAKSGDISDAALAFETLIPMDVLGLAKDRQRYGFFTSDRGGILDDLMFANRGDHLFLVVNAACKNADIAHLHDQIGDQVDIEVLDRSLIAVQGPLAEDIMCGFNADFAGMMFMDVADIEVMGATCFVSRSGYTGEDGYEISIPNAHATAIARAILDAGATPVGLGARDSLRLEAGLCLYGNDMDQTTTPVAADLRWAMQKVRRNGGDRAGGFPGADVILEELKIGAPRRRVGLCPDGRAPMRAGTRIFETDDSDTPIGEITSGGFGPSFGAPVAMGYVHTEHARRGATLSAELRGKRLPVRVADLPFVPHQYKRK